MLNRLNVPVNTVSTPDPDATQLPYWPITGAVYACVGATCAQASGTLTYRLVFTDQLGVLTGVSPAVTLTAAAGPADFGSAWLGTPPPGTDPTVAVCADRMALKVDAIVGTWNINAQVFSPSPVTG